MGEVVPARTSPTLHPPHCASTVVTSTLRVNVDTVLLFIAFVQMVPKVLLTRFLVLNFQLQMLQSMLPTI